jgi:hypothetical protein
MLYSNSWSKIVNESVIPRFGYPGIVWAPYHIFWNLERYCVVLTKPRRNIIPSLGYIVNTMGWIILVQATKGVLLMPKRIQWTCNTLLRYPRNTLGSTTYILKHGGVLHSPTKTYKETNIFIKILCNLTSWVYFIRRVLLMHKTIQYTYNTPCRVSQKYIGMHNISFETWRGIA